MAHLTMGIHCEKCIVRQFPCPVYITEYTNASPCDRATAPLGYKPVPCDTILSTVSTYCKYIHYLEL